MTKEQFDSLPENEKRITLAKDVIALLASKKILTQNYSTYIYNKKLLSNEVEFPDPENIELKLIFEEYPCYVCAKGALFVADIMRNNNCFVTNARLFGVLKEAEDKIEERLVETFNETNLNELERYFEGWHTDSARKFKTEHQDPEQRLIILMENIIANDGRFVPDKLVF